MAFLLDTNVLSELRKKQNINTSVKTWWDATPQHLVYLSVLTLGEIRTGIETKRRRDPVQARMLEVWLQRMQLQFADRILPITDKIADRWGTLGIDQRIPDVDGLIAATALEHGLTVVTRNVDDFVRSGVPVLNPWI